MDEFEKKNTPDGADEKLERELESLRATFQRQWDIARGETPDGPVIQSLEEIPEEDDEEEEEPSPREPEKAADEAPKKQKKPRRHGRTALKAIVCLLLAAAFAFFAFYFVTSMRHPDFSLYLKTLVASRSAADDEEKLELYEEALALDGDIRLFRKKVTDEAALLTAKTKGLEAAGAFITEHYPDDALEKASKEVRALNAYYTGKPSGDEKIDQLAAEWKTQNEAAIDAAFAASLKAYQNADPAGSEILDDRDEPTQLSAGAQKSLMEEIGANDLFAKDMGDALEYIRQGLVSEEDKTETGYKAAAAAYLYADNVFDATFGHRCQGLLERLTVLLYNNGDLYNTIDLLKNDFTDDLRTLPVGEEFAAVKTSVDALLEAKLDPMALAQTYVAQESFSVPVIEKALPAAVPDFARTETAQIVYDTASALRERETKNLSQAILQEVTALSSADALGFMDLRALAADVFSLSVQLGYFDNADYVVGTYLKDEAENPAAHRNDGKAVAAFIEEYEAYQQLEGALKTCNDAFADYVLEDGTVDADGAFAALDALTENTEDAYLIGFSNYYKCVALNHDANKEEDADLDAAMLGYMETWAEAMPDHVLLWGRQLAELYRTTGHMGSTLEVAEKILALNVGDDYANAMLSLKERIRGNLESAKALALSGADLAGIDNECAKEAAICDILAGDMPSAVETLQKIVSNNVTPEILGLIKVAAGLYDGGDEDFAGTAKSLLSECDAVMNQYGYNYPADVDALLSGTKRPRDVFLKGTYYLQ
ncbi:MAG: hypothetical protein IK104_06475 [Clostridia bacterium]|nr:hypothetical protein [Clostridia bacterium]